MIKCPVCERPASDPQELGGLTGISCPRCGLIALAVAFYLLGQRLGSLSEPEGRHRRSRLSHILRRQQGQATYASIPIEQLDEWRLNDPLPSPMEQVDSLLLWIGDHQPSTGQYLVVPELEVAAWIGTIITADELDEGVEFTLANLASLGLLQRGSGGSRMTVRLTLPGWERHEELKRGRAASRTAFMAMKFGDGDLNAVVRDCFKPAVDRAGFRLRALNDGQGAGLIDDQMRVAIRTARFVIADLTHRNNGAYWEAGFAEGLGKPVIYTCRKDEWDRREVHFDANHLVHVIWTPETLTQVAERLIATIRATLPDEAVMTDSGEAAT